MNRPKQRKQDAVQNAAKMAIELDWKNKTLFLGDNLHVASGFSYKAKQFPEKILKYPARV